MGHVRMSIKFRRLQTYCISRRNTQQQMLYDITQCQIHSYMKETHGMDWSETCRIVKLQTVEWSTGFAVTKVCETVCDFSNYIPHKNKIPESCANKFCLMTCEFKCVNFLFIPVSVRVVKVGVRSQASGAGAPHSVQRRLQVAATATARQQKEKCRRRDRDETHKDRGCRQRCQEDENENKRVMSRRQNKWNRVRRRIMRRSVQKKTERRDKERRRPSGSAVTCNASHGN